MTFRELTSTLSLRLRRRDYWAVFGFSCLVYGAWISSRSWPPRDVFTLLVTQSLYFFAMMWLTPLPWQWTGRSGDTPNLWRGGLQAFPAAVGMICFLTFLDDFLLNWPQPLRLGPKVYLQQACFQGLLLFLVGNALASREREEMEKAELGHMASEARTRALQGQLHPHVLFNALNALAELYRDEPRLADTHLRSMSDLLRQVLQASERATQPLAEERLLVERYLFMESARLGPRLQVAWEWDRNLDTISTLPLLLQPLVENALKHGIAPAKRGGELVVACFWDGTLLTLQVRNTGLAPGKSSAPSSGVGIRNLRERLALAYGPAASFELRHEAPWTIAEVRIRPTQSQPFMKEGAAAHPPLPPPSLRTALEEA